ncbi:response regulator [Ectothiorhodospira shaposhnikovii]|uniref:response regulator n=1 Tax=Ectothiorhodospira shaposhnikovii TaxID=1054 RepID=UPI001EE78F35|nr:response regulator [Ectothiorhodospira shaposhnikovii]MCG5512769.1 response regulator [Ectothiorhodospira shaposhnikovii]
MSRVLVLDDEPDILEELEAMLKRAGFDPIVRTDPRQALECLEQDIGIRILVSDIRMPGWDGMDLVRALTKSQGEDRAEIVFMSGYASRDHVQSALRMEAADFLFKPFREQEFILAVRRALRRDLEKRQLREVLSITQGQLSKIESRLRYLHSEKEDIEPESVRGGSRTAADGKDGGLASAGARRILKNAAEARALRGRFFDPELCSGATWNIMVDLMIARLANRPDYVSSLAVGSGIPLTTALRHVEDLVNRGLVRKERDPSDRRRVFLWLTDEAARKMEGFLEACASDSLLEI